MASDDGSEVADHELVVGFGIFDEAQEIVDVFGCPVCNGEALYMACL